MLIDCEFPEDLAIKELTALRAHQLNVQAVHSVAVALEYEGSEDAGADQLDEALARIADTIAELDQALEAYGETEYA